MTETTAPELSDAERTERRQRRQTWYGYLADDNVQHIADRVRAMLVGRRYAFVANNADHKFSHPELRTGQRLRPQTKFPDGLRVYRIGDPDWDGKPADSCGISASDTYGSWGMHSRYATEVAARDDEHGRFRTYVTIEGGVGEHPQYGRIEITQHNGYGEVLHWVIVVEQPDDEEVTA